MQTGFRRHLVGLEMFVTLMTLVRFVGRLMIMRGHFPQLSD